MHHEWYNGEGYRSENPEMISRYMRGSLKSRTVMMR